MAVMVPGRPKRFLHVGFHWTRSPRTKEVESVFNQAPDWLRYAPNCWILWTSRSPSEWLRRIKPLLGPDDHVLICELNLEAKQGWLPRSVWDWLNDDRQTPSKTGGVWNLDYNGRRIQARTYRSGRRWRVEVVVKTGQGSTETHQLLNAPSADWSAETEEEARDHGFAIGQEWIDALS